MEESNRVLQLFVLNLALQVFDGVATYNGMAMGWKEANPLLVFAFSHLGVGPALLLFKLKACLLLALLHRHRDHRSVPPVLMLLAGAYSSFSLVPWLAKFVGTLAQ